MAGRTLSEGQLEELEHRGFLVVPALLDRGLAARACEFVDALVGSAPPAPGVVGLERVPEERGQPGPWPAEGDRRPVITSNGWKHSIQHPICDSDYPGFAGIMAELLTPFVALNQQLLRGGGPDESGGLKLMQQFFRRTDVSPPPHHGCHDPWVEPRSWHMVRRLLFALRLPTPPAVPCCFCVTCCGGAAGSRLLALPLRRPNLVRQAAAPDVLPLVSS